MAQELMNSETGEITEFGSAQPLAVQIAMAEINQAVSTARAFPRSITKAKANITQLATLDKDTAEANVYALPRGGKAIRGPSVRLAEIIAAMWGNCHVASRVVAVDRFEKTVTAEGVFHDLETGLRRTAQVQRRIVDKYGKLYNDDMIITTGNAAASIAMREAVLKGIPRAVWGEAFDACENVIKGDVKTLVERRDAAFKAFAAFGVTPEQIYLALEIGGVDDLGLDELVTLTAWRSSIKAGELAVETLFPPIAKDAKPGDAAKGTAAKLGKIADQGKPADTGGKADAAGAKGKDKPKADAKPKDGEKAASGPETGKADEGQQANAEGDNAQAGGAGGGEPLTFDDAALEAAFARGEEAKRKGMARKALPPEWRAEGYEPLADAWVRGWTETEAP